MNSDNNPYIYPPGHISVEAQKMAVFNSILQLHIAKM